MKKLSFDPSKCQGCLACETACSQAWFKQDAQDKSCIRIKVDSAGNYVAQVCDQCGDCKEMCSAMAISRDKNGVVRIDKKKCVGCLICVGECLRDYMHYHDDLPIPFKCVACGICVKACPTGALEIVDEEEK